MSGLFRVLGIVTIGLAVIYGFVEIGSASSDFQQFMAVVTAIGIGLGSMIWFFMGEVVGLLEEIRNRLPAPKRQAEPAITTETVQEEGRPA